MLWRDTVDLISTTSTTNEYGDPIETETAATVYANKKSIRQSEFYQAQVTDFRPELMFEVRTEEYSDEPKLKYDGKTYTIIRTFSKNSETTELICSGLAGE